jgi:hypothetical protein
VCFPFSKTNSPLKNTFSEIPFTTIPS